MNTKSYFSGEKIALMPSAFCAVLWVAAVAVPVLFLMKDHFHLSDEMMAVGGLIAFNACVGVTWLIAGLGWVAVNGVGSFFDGSSSGVQGANEIEPTPLRQTANPADGTIMLNEFFDINGNAPGTTD